MTLVERLRSFARLIAVDRSSAPNASAGTRLPLTTSPPITDKVQRADNVLARNARLSEARRRLDQVNTHKLNDYLESRLAFAREVAEELEEENL